MIPPHVSAGASAGAGAGLCVREPSPPATGEGAREKDL